MNSQEEKLQQEIIADARKQAERIVAKAENDAARGLKAAREENDRKRQEYLKELTEDIEARCQAMKVKTDLTVRRNWLRYRETLMRDFLRDALRQAEALPAAEMRRSLECLAREALAELGPGEYDVSFSPEDAAVVSGQWLQGIAAGLGLGDCVFHPSPGLARGRGIVFRTPDGRRTFDNTYANRLRIMQDDLRREIFA